MVRPKDRPLKPREDKAAEARKSAPPPPTMLKASLDKQAPAKATAPKVSVKAQEPKADKAQEKAKREQRTKRMKSVKACPKCAGFMYPTTHFARDGEGASFTSDNRLRSFGGVELKTFECEKCHYTTQFQVDPFPKDIGED